MNGDRNRQVEAAIGSGISVDPDDRTLILWLGTSSAELLNAECLRRGLTLLPVSNEDLERAAPYARVLVLEVPESDSTFHTWGARIISAALNHGLRVALVQYEPDNSLPLMEDATAVERFFAAVKGLPRDPERTFAFYRDFGRVAQWADRHRPGPGANRGLNLQGDVPEDSAVRLLMQRAFGDLSSISIELLSGGRSGASVWRVQPDISDHSRRALPFIAKVHRRDKMLTERSNYRIVRNAVESRLCAPLDVDRSVEGNSLGLVVYDVVERALPFKIALSTSPAVLITSLFGQTLRGFHSSLQTSTRRPEAELIALKLLKWSSQTLREAAANGSRSCSADCDVNDLERRISSIPAIPLATGTVHGDLTVRNLFAAAGASDVLLIDYGSVRQNAIAASDPACLEVSLTFSSDEDSSHCPSIRISPEWYRAAYRYPLDPSGVPALKGSDSWVGDAVRAIRSQARLIEPRSVPYAVAVAGYLLRFASFEDNGAEGDRALAYELASALILRVEAEVSSPGAVSA
jgi:hypothetical protein